VLEPVSGHLLIKVFLRNIRPPISLISTDGGVNFRHFGELFVYLNLFFTFALPNSESFFMTNITFTMIKPDAVGNGHIGPILAKINEAGFRIVAMKYFHLEPEKAAQFYAVHKAR